MFFKSNLDFSMLFGQENMTNHDWIMCKRPLSQNGVVVGGKLTTLSNRINRRSISINE